MGIYIQYIQIVVLASEPVGGRSRVNCPVIINYINLFFTVVIIYHDIEIDYDTLIIFFFCSLENYRFNLTSNQ